MQIFFFDLMKCSFDQNRTRLYIVSLYW